MHRRHHGGLPLRLCRDRFRCTASRGDAGKREIRGLRFGTEGHNDEQEGMIELAEYMSGRVCEVCGNRGKVLCNGWIKTRCPYHETV
jgi:hypothetical protein